MTKRLTDKEAKDILSDPVDFKLVMAKYYLQKIDTTAHLDYDWNHFVLESYAESFLFFANLSLEVIAFQINKELHVIADDKFNTQMIERVPTKSLWQEGQNIVGGLFYESLTIYKIRKALSTSDPRQKSILDIIDKYFQYPRKISSDWDLSCTSLWQLRELRNHIAHFQLFNRHVIAGGPTHFLFRFKVQNPDPKNGVSGIKLGIIEDNPYRYFSNLFNDLVQFVKEIRNIIPYSNKSLRHNNAINFEL